MPFLCSCGIERAAVEMAAMPSLREVSSASPVVVLDAASSLVQVGVIEADGGARWESSPDEAGVAVFQGLERLGVDPLTVGCWVFCAGPGSVLGIRTVAVALRTWRMLRPVPVFGYHSLALVAHALGRRDTAIIADARRETWHHYTFAAGLRRVATADLAGDLVMPENFRHWSTLPAGVTRAPYRLAALMPLVWHVELLHPSEAPDAFLHEEPNYVTWTPQIHRAPGS